MVDDDSTLKMTIIKEDSANGGKSAGLQQGVDASEQKKQHEEVSSREEAADAELEGLALSSSITELNYALEAISTLIFEIQELRHLSSASNADTSGEGGQTTEVDVALLKLEDQLVATSDEVDALQARITLYIKTTPAGLLRHKWDETLSTWHKLQKEAEDMREELVEDKYLIVYRTVSRQAEDMMQSLEKIFAQCNTFVHELYKTCRTRPNPDKEDLQKQLNICLNLHKSLHQKTKYYIPSCEKVLKVIDSGISQQKRSLNGEILRSHADMKLRWRNLQERMSRTEKEMQGVQELLSDLSAKATRMEQQASSDSITSSSASTSSIKSSSSTPSRSSVTTARNKVGDWLSPSPTSRKSAESKASDTTDSPTQTRSITPFRRLANRLHRSKTDEASPPAMPAPLPSSSTSSSRASQSPEKQRTPLPKPKPGLAYAAPTYSAPAMPRTVSSPATTSDRQNRRLSRIPATSAFATPDVPLRPSHISSTTSERARSPLPPPRSSTSMGTSAMASSTNKPMWSVSTRRPQAADLGSSMPASSSGPATRGRKSMPSAGTMRNPSARFSHINSTYSQSRPQSRIFTTPQSNFRPPSPSFSATSNTSASAIRPRPSSPNSRIPVPGQSAERNGTRRHHGSPGGGEDMETLYFGGHNAQQGEEAGSSLMQRALSPTPSASAFSVTSSTAGTPGRRQSRIPRLSLGDVEPPDLKMLNMPPPPKLPDMYRSSRSEIMTPEPALRSKAARVSAMYGARPRGVTGRKSFGPSSEFSTPQPQRLTASTSGARPSSRLSVGGTGLGGSSRRSSFYAPSTSSRLATPLPGISSDGTSSLAYHPNKHDPLDVEIAQIVNSQPLYVYCQREGPPLSKLAAEAQTMNERNAHYWLANNDKPVHCKLVDRGDRKPKKVLCKIDGQYQDLAIYLLNQQAQY